MTTHHCPSVHIVFCIQVSTHYCVLHENSSTLLYILCSACFVLHISDCTLVSKLCSAYKWLHKILNFRTNKNLGFNRKCAALKKFTFVFWVAIKLQQLKSVLLYSYPELTAKNDNTDPVNTSEWSPLPWQEYLIVTISIGDSCDSYKSFQRLWLVQASPTDTGPKKLFKNRRKTAFVIIFFNFF